MRSSDRDEQARTWQRLYDRTRALLLQVGREDATAAADFWVHDDYWGYPQVKIFVNRLTLLRPSVIKSLQALLVDFPGWEVVVAVFLPGVGDRWPAMGLTIRAHEIIDGLQRHYFPKDFQDLRYEGSRPGSERD